MKLTVFQSDKGDCLLVRAADGTSMLVDGGMRASYSQHVASALGRLAEDGGELDLVYVSHIDRDHISGVLQLMEDLIAWRVRDFQHDGGNDGFRDPPRPRPPAVKGLWHNAFHEQVGDNTGAVADALAANAAVLEADEAQQALAEAQRGLSTSVGEGIELSRRVSADQLGIPLNAQFSGKLAMVRGQKTQPIALGSLSLTVLGPFERDLTNLRKDWNKWLQDQGAALARLREEMRADAERLSTGEVGGFRERLEERARTLGDRHQVTPPNLASLMLLAEEDGKTVLLTGDGHADDILNGLEHARRLDDDPLHVNVLKVQHHGSEHNIHAEFCRRITADHYVFCANGEHENPDLDVLKLVVASRDGDARHFKLWFNSSSEASTSKRGRRHMKKVETLVASLADKSDGRMRSSFLDGSSFDLSP